MARTKKTEVTPIDEIQTRSGDEPTIVDQLNEFLEGLREVAKRTDDARAKFGVAAFEEFIEKYKIK